MREIGYLLIGLFLPLYPLSIGFNAVFERIDHPLLRAALLLAWPQVGLLGFSMIAAEPPSWLVIWALATSALYAFRLLAMREMGRWTGFLATSAWALLWLPASAGVQASQLWPFAAAFSVPLVFLTLLARILEQRFGAAYTGLYGGLAQSMPRFAGVLVISVLAATATPVFPSFFTLLGTLIVSQPLPAVVLAVVWLMWSWAAARLLQGLIVGAADPGPHCDLDTATAWRYAIGLAGLVFAGLILTGGSL
jgi:NADH:ubiquinone oxidoreductase subunit 4 (subunit M)